MISVNFRVCFDGSVAMRRFLLATVMFGVACGAQAADMPDLPILRGAFTEAPARGVVNWQGYYVGGQGGYGSSGKEFSRPPSKTPFLQGRFGWGVILSEKGG